MELIKGPVNKLSKTEETGCVNMPGELWDRPLHTLVGSSLEIGRLKWDAKVNGRTAARDAVVAPAPAFSSQNALLGTWKAFLGLDARFKKL